MLKDSDQSNFETLAQKARNEYLFQPGLIEVTVEGDPPIGLRYRFNEKVSATRFLFIRGLFRRVRPENTELSIDGSDVLEVWNE